MDKRTSLGEKTNCKRMATVATVYTIPPNFREPENVIDEEQCQMAKENKTKPCPENKHVWASVEKIPEKVIEDAFMASFLQRSVH